jgi:hypothetical protein
MGHSRLESSRYQGNKLISLFNLTFNIAYNDNHSNLLTKGEKSFYFSFLIEIDSR